MFHTGGGHWDSSAIVTEQAKNPKLKTGTINELEFYM